MLVVFTEVLFFKYYYVFFYTLLLLDSDSEDEDGQESRKREGKTCSKGPQVSPTRATALWPYSMWSPANPLS